MISKTPGYSTSDGQWFNNLELAQANELTFILKPTTQAEKDSFNEICLRIVHAKEQAIAILGMKQRGRPKAVAPVKKPRKAKVDAQTQGYVDVIRKAKPVPTSEPEPVEEERPHVKACKV